MQRGVVAGEQRGVMQRCSARCHCRGEMLAFSPIMGHEEPLLVFPDQKSSRLGADSISWERHLSRHGDIQPSRRALEACPGVFHLHCYFHMFT